MSSVANLPIAIIMGGKTQIQIRPEYDIAKDKLGGAADFPFSGIAKERTSRRFLGLNIYAKPTKSFKGQKMATEVEIYAFSQNSTICFLELGTLLV